MIVTTREALFESLKQGVREDKLTPGRKIDEATFVCVAVKNAAGTKDYMQGPFESIPTEWQSILKDKGIGFKHGPIKVLAVFDVWD